VYGEEVPSVIERSITNFTPDLSNSRYVIARALFPTLALARSASEQSPGFRRRLLRSARNDTLRVIMGIAGQTSLKKHPATDFTDFRGFFYFNPREFVREASVAKGLDLLSFLEP
jgi:hypothetical protein